MKKGSVNWSPDDKKALEFAGKTQYEKLEAIKKATEPTPTHPIANGLLRLFGESGEIISKISDGK